MTSDRVTYPEYRFPAEIISRAVWLHHVFSLSLRDVELIPRVLALQAEGLSLRAIASTRNIEGFQTPHSGAWTATAVRRVLVQLNEAAINREAA